MIFTPLEKEFFPQAWFQIATLNFAIQSFFPIMPTHLETTRNHREKKRGRITTRPQLPKIFWPPYVDLFGRLQINIDRMLYKATLRSSQFITYLLLLSGPFRYNLHYFLGNLTVRSSDQSIETIIHYAISCCVEASTCVNVNDAGKNIRDYYHEIIVIASATVLENLSTYLNPIKDVKKITSMSKTQIKTRQSLICELSNAFYTRYRDEEAVLLAHQLVDQLDSSISN